jgi:hypothetical protein
LISINERQLSRSCDRRLSALDADDGVWRQSGKGERLAAEKVMLAS